MIKLTTITLLTLTAYANQGFEGFRVYQTICPEGETYMVKASGKIDEKTGKFVPSSGRPITKCVKVEERKKETKKPKAPKKPEKIKEDKTPTVLQILKYGGPHGMGGSFPSMSSCMEEQKRLTQENAGLDYSYKCVKK